MRRITQKDVKKLRRRYPQWKHLTDEQLLVAAKVIAVVRVKFRLEKMKYELAGKTQNAEAVVP